MNNEIHLEIFVLLQSSISTVCVGFGVGLSRQGNSRGAPHATCVVAWKCLPKQSLVGC